MGSSYRKLVGVPMMAIQACMCFRHLLYIGLFMIWQIVEDQYRVLADCSMKMNGISFRVRGFVSLVTV
jgi:hypothetical protein